METSVENQKFFSKSKTLGVFVPCPGHSFGKLTTENVFPLYKDSRITDELC